MPKNNLAHIMKQQHDKGVIDGGFYWTSVMVLAIHNLYGWTGKAFDKIEAEMKRIDDEMHSDDISWKSEQLVHYIEEIRGKDYIHRR